MALIGGYFRLMADFMKARDLERFLSPMLPLLVAFITCSRTLM
jgi:hypothetical protein